jgi:hypothetical protein
MKIITIAINNIDFIEIQNYTLKKFMKGEYEFIVFNDAKNFPDYTNEGDINIRSKIELICNNLNIKCINIPNDNHKNNQSPSLRNSNSLNYILNYQINNPDKYLLIDSDMFLIDFFDINKYENYDCAIVLQTRNNETLKYFWGSIYYFDILKMKNINLLNWNCSKDCDTGGSMQEWLKLQEKDNIYFINGLSSLNWDENDLPNNFKNNNLLIKFLINDPRNINNKFFCEIFDDSFLHYRSGSNWRREGLDLHKILTKELKNILL